LIWEQCRRIKQVKQAQTCFICGSDLTKKKSRQLGHLIPKVVLPTQMKYDLRLLEPCCYHCNINCGGNGYIFGKKMEDTYGKEFVEQIYKDFLYFKSLDKMSDKEKLAFYSELLEKYKLILPIE
jgi:hypothetical protein